MLCERWAEAGRGEESLGGAATREIMTVSVSHCSPHESWKGSVTVCARRVCPACAGMGRLHLLPRIGSVHTARELTLTLIISFSAQKHEMKLVQCQ